MLVPRPQTRENRALNALWLLLMLGALLLALSFLWRDRQAWQAPEVDARTGAQLEGGVAR